MDWYQCDHMLKIKSSHSNFYFEIMFSLRPKVTIHLGFFLRKFVTKNFQKLPYLVELVGSFNIEPDEIWRQTFQITKILHY